MTTATESASILYASKFLERKRSSFWVARRMAGWSAEGGVSAKTLGRYGRQFNLSLSSLLKGHVPPLYSPNPIENSAMSRSRMRMRSMLRAGPDFCFTARYKRWGGYGRRKSRSTSSVNLLSAHSVRL